MRIRPKDKRISNQVKRKVKNNLYANNPYYKELIDKRDSKPKIHFCKAKGIKTSKKAKKNNLIHLFDKPYSEFLKSSYWFRVRKIILKRDNNKCTCGSKNKLQVHHLTYKNHFKELENLQDLITLCEICHKKAHDIE